MPKHEMGMPLRSWVKPAVRRLVGGSAEFGGGGAPDGSGIFS